MKANLTKRVFIGIPIGHEIKHILPQLKISVKCHPNYIQWVSETNLHLTLSFMGNISINIIPDLINELAQYTANNYFKIKIEGAGVFPTPFTPQILWLGVSEGVKKLSVLQSNIEKSAMDYKNNKRKTKFTPHITIARSGKNPLKIDALPFLSTVYSPIELDVNSIYLYESKLLAQGVQYKVLSEFPLN